VVAATGVTAMLTAQLALVLAAAFAGGAIFVSWGHLHAGRSALGVAATLMFLWATMA
jgi:hypothetical protein